MALPTPLEAPVTTTTLLLKRELLDDDGRIGLDQSQTPFP